jgi:glycine/D-amino acid oxidase-like deaminating enzyme/nitrite reductase/ring-hydroxylating ferredoxin subunit
MDTGSGRSVSVWMPSSLGFVGTPLDEDRATEVCVIGGGISGLTTAYLLAHEGQRVIVLEDGTIGSGETGRTTAHLSNAIDDRYVELERLHGGDGARLAAESHRAAIDRIAAIAAENDIDCDFEYLDGYLFVPPGESTRILDDELAAAHRAGLTDVEMMMRAPLDEFDTGACLRFPRQATFHPGRYLAGLARAIRAAGGEIFTHTRVRDMESGAPAHVKIDGGHTITAEHVVVATNSPINDLYVIHTKQAPYRTFAIAARVPAGSVTRALYWDTPDPYHYVRLAHVISPVTGDPEDVLIVGGEDHKTGQADDAALRYTRLEGWARQRWPQMGEVLFRWSGQVFETIDGLAYIGRNPKDSPNIYIITGDSGHGMTHGTIGGMIVSDLIAGRPNPWAGLYDPSRKTLRAARDYISENLNVARQYTDYLKRSEVSSVEELPAGHGAIIRRGTELVAVCRDAAGELHERSAKCTHMGCIVQWNSEEQSWDCPCHGSRFDAKGAILTGPAIYPLDEPKHTVIEQPTT